MTGLRQLVAAPGPAILFVALFALMFAGGFGAERAPMIVALGLGGVIGAGLVLSGAALFGRHAGPLLLVGAGFALAILLADGAADMLGWTGIVQKFGLFVGVLVLLAVGLQAQVAIPLVVRARTAVAVPRAYAYEQAVPQPTTAYWKPHARRIEAIPGAPDRFKQMFTNPNMPEGAHLTVALSDVTPGERFTVTVVPGGEGDLGAGQEEVETWTFADHPIGTQIQTEVRLTKGQVMTYLVALVVAPQVDQLRQFKAVLEGEDDVSFAAGFRTGE